jgi:hypothetical protein
MLGEGGNGERPAIYQTDQAAGRFRQGQCIAGPRSPVPEVIHAAHGR